MSLRTNFTGTLDSKLADARTNGYTAVTVTILADLTTQMAVAANRGMKKFTYTFVATYQPADLRLLGPLWEAFKSGVEQGLYSQDIMGNEFNVVLNTSDQLSTGIDLNFDFYGLTAPTPCSSSLNIGLHSSCAPVKIN